MTQAPPDVAHQLSDDDLARLRAGYDRAGLIDLSQGAVVGLYRGALDVIRTLTDHFYRAPALDPRTREAVLIALLAVNGSPRMLAIHLYWGLMEGLSPTEIAETLALTGSYAGVPRLSMGLLTMDGAWKALRGALDATAGPVAFRDAIGALARQFPA